MIQKSRAVRYKTAAEMVSWTVVDFDGLPIDDAENYLNSLRARDCSVNTVESYARCLAAYFSWLTARSCDWSEIIFDDLADFIYTFKQGMPPLEKRGGGTRKNLRSPPWQPSFVSSTSTTDWRTELTSTTSD